MKSSKQNYSKLTIDLTARLMPDLRVKQWFV